MLLLAVDNITVYRRELTPCYICSIINLSTLLNILQDDFISFRHHTYDMPRGNKSLELKERGPRFEMKLYQIKLGTLDQSHAENEYILRSYVNSAKRAKLSSQE